MVYANESVSGTGQTARLSHIVQTEKTAAAKAGVHQRVGPDCVLQSSLAIL